MTLIITIPFIDRFIPNERTYGPVSHVDKIYSLLSHQIAHHLYTIVESVEAVYVWLDSREALCDRGGGRCMTKRKRFGV